MKKNGVLYAVLAVFGVGLIYDIQYYLSRSASGHLVKTDKVMCIIDGVICLAVVIVVIVKLVLKYKNGDIEAQKEALIKKSLEEDAEKYSSEE